MWYAVNRRVDVSFPQGDIERDGIHAIGVCFCHSDDFRLVCTRPCFAPGHLTSLTSFPADCSGRVVRRERSSSCSGRGQRLCGGYCGSLAAETLHNQVAQRIGCSGQCDKALQSRSACRLRI